jgi:hypothetical protein
MAKNKYRVNLIYIPSGNLRSLFKSVAMLPSAHASTIGDAKLNPNTENKFILFL